MAFYYRRDDWVTNAVGQALPDAQVWICSQPATATTVPPSPLVSVFSNSSGTATTFPLVTDGFGHTACYVASGIYTVVYYHPAIGIVVQPDQFIGLGAAPPQGGVLSVTASLPLTSTGGANPNIDGTYHGNKTTGPNIQLSDGTGTAGNFATYDAAGNLTDGGAPSPGGIVDVTATLPITVTGTTTKDVSANYHGNSTKIQLSDNTGTSGNFPKFDASGNLTDGMAPSVDIVCYAPSILATNQNILHYNSVRGISYPVNLSGSICNSLVAATANTTININKNGVNAGTILFTAAGTTGAFTLAGGMTLAATDYLDFIVVAGDATLAGVSLTIKGTRTS